MLHPELVAGASGTTHAHSLQTEDVNLDEVSGHQSLKPGLVSSPPCIAMFHQSSSFTSMGDSDCSTTDTASNNYNCDDTVTGLFTNSHHML